MTSSLNYMDLCRLCLVKEQVAFPIFDGEDDVRQIFIKISTCLPVKVSKEDRLPKKICSNCVYRVENSFEFWNTTASAEKQLLEWLEENCNERKVAPSAILSSTNQETVMEAEQLVLKEETLEQDQSASSKNASRVGAIQTEEGAKTVEGGGSDEEEEEVESEDGEEAMGNDSEESGEEDVEEPANKEEVESEDEEEDEPYEELEPTTFVNVSLACDEAGPSGAQQTEGSEQKQQQQSRTKADSAAATSVCGSEEPSTSTAAPSTSGLNQILLWEQLHKRYVESVFVRPYLMGQPASPRLLDYTEFQNLHFQDSIDKMLLSYQNRGNLGSLSKMLPNSSKSPENVIYYGYSGESNIFNNLDSLKTPADTNVTADSNTLLKQLLDDNSESFGFPGQSKHKFEWGAENLCTPVLSKQGDCEKGTDNLCSQARNKQQKQETGAENVEIVCSPAESKQQDRKWSAENFCLQEVGEQENHEWNMRNDDFCCNICRKVCFTKSQLKNHMVSHTDARPFKCNVCGRTYKRGFELKKHLTTHTGEMEHICDICGYATFQKSNLVVHRKRHLNDYKFRCTVCRKGYYTNTELQRHMIVHLGQCPFQCDICGRAYLYKSNLAMHKKKHEPNYHKILNYQCEFCGKIFLHNNSLRIHRKYHLGENQLVCDICGKTLSGGEALKVHRRIHTGEKPFVCDVCGKRFSKHDYLKVHRRVHTGEKPHTCNECGKAFSQLSTLMIHKRLHTGLKPYRCDTCSKCFVSKTLLKNHLKIHQT